MLKDYLDFVGRKYREEAGTDGGDAGGGPATTGASTEGADTGTVLTGDTGTEGADTNSDSSADAGDGDAGTTDNGGDSDAGTEGSNTPPDTYADFTMPEGMQIDETALTEAIPVFKELGLTQEQAQRLVDIQAAQVKASSEKQIDDFNQLMNDWREQSKNDSEYGGEKFDENVKLAQAAINKYGTSELKQLLEQQGVGNHPEVIRFMVRVGQTLKEDVPGSSGAASSPAQDRVNILYPNSKDG